MTDKLRCVWHNPATRQACGASADAGMPWPPGSPLCRHHAALWRDREVAKADLRNKPKPLDKPNGRK